MGIYTKIIDLQKLQMAWKIVRSKHAAPGVDQITWQDFEADWKENLKQLQIELRSKSYQPEPVKLIQIDQGNKLREVSLFCMRDKVVQQSMVSELNRVYQPQYPSVSYAYRAGQSALKAIDKLHREICGGKYAAILCGDIQSFFDSIPIERLMQRVRKDIGEEEVLDLLEKMLRTQSLDASGELQVKKTGIYQGSVLAPLLSNVYLLDLDREMSKETIVYVRYSDDFAALCENKEQALTWKEKLRKKFSDLELTLHPEKTKVGALSEGFVFLGYEFSEKGKSIPEKAKRHLQDSMEEIWMKQQEMSVDEKIDAMQQMTDGWGQYYQMERTPESILEIAVVVKGGNYEDPIQREQIKRNRKQVHNIYHELVPWMADFWRSQNDLQMVLYEYEDFYNWDTLQESGSQISEELLQEFIDCYELLYQQGTKENYTELMQLYTDIGLYSFAEKISDQLETLSQGRENHAKIGMASNADISKDGIIGDINLYMDLFLGREDIYKEEFDEQGRRRYQEVAQAVTIQDIRSHFSGERILATYVQRSNATAHYLIFDIDISKKVLLQSETEQKGIDQYINQAAEMALQLMDVIRQIGLQGYAEYSGYRGYHVWIFFQDWIAVRYINYLSDRILQRMELKDDILVEVIPNKSHLRLGKAGQAIKLPCGIHSKSGQRSQMLNSDLSIVQDVDRYLHDIVRYSLNEVKRASNMAAPQKTSNQIQKLTIDPKVIKCLNTGIKGVLQNCSLMKYMYCKAEKTGYLTHQERLSVLYVFGHMGDEGKEFVHTIMEMTVNYQYHITQKFIDRIPAKPVSCTKLRDQYKQITAEYGCSCVFKRSKNCYPSPVLHAVKLSKENELDITVPAVKELTKETEKKVKQEINIQSHVQQMAKRILDLKKQKRGIERAISRVDKELSQIYDTAGVDCMEIEMGLLCREKREDELTNWYIEL